MIDIIVLRNRDMDVEGLLLGDSSAYCILFELRNN